MAKKDLGILFSKERMLVLHECWVEEFFDSDKDEWRRYLTDDEKFFVSIWDKCGSHGFKFGTRACRK